MPVILARSRTAASGRARLEQEFSHLATRDSLLLEFRRFRKHDPHKYVHVITHRFGRMLIGRKHNNALAGLVGMPQLATWKTRAQLSAQVM